MGVLSKEMNGEKHKLPGQDYSHWHISDLLIWSYYIKNNISEVTVY